MYNKPERWNSGKLMRCEFCMQLLFDEQVLTVKCYHLPVSEINSNSRLQVVKSLITIMIPRNSTSMAGCALL